MDEGNGFCGVGVYCSGMDGNGGTSPGPELVAGRRGDCSQRKVRLLMELELLARRKFCGREAPRLGWVAMDARRWIRLV